MQKNDERNGASNAELDKDQKELVEEIRSSGIEIDSVYDLIDNFENAKYTFIENKFTGKYNKVYPILVDHLDKPHHPRIREGIIRALTEKDARDIAKDKLLEHFYKETDRILLWVLANALTILLTPAEKKKNPDIARVKNGLM